MSKIGERYRIVYRKFSNHRDTLSFTKLGITFSDLNWRGENSIYSERLLKPIYDPL